MFLWPEVRTLGSVMWTCTKGMLTFGPRGESLVPRDNCNSIEVVSVVDG
jgi:hypothetical protein